MNELKKAIIAAGNELETEHGWACGDGGEDLSEETETFVTVLFKHISPLVDTTAFNAARISALRAEADELEKSMDVTLQRRNR